MELKEIRRKITSVKNIRELTSALETLSAIKMKTAQKIANQSRPFAQKVAKFLEILEPTIEKSESLFLKERKIEKILVGIIASDRGFCGSFNQNILKFAQKETKEIEKEGVVEIFPIGKKAIKFFEKEGYKIRFSFFGIGDYGELEEIKPISDFLVRSFLENKFQKIYFLYTDFISTFFQKPKKIQILPLKRKDLEDFLKKEKTEVEKEEFLIEPSAKMVIEEIVPQLVEYLIYQAILEANASEHSARMMAMREASENAKKRSEELGLIYNKARQEQITREVCEISSTKEVLEY